MDFGNRLFRLLKAVANDKVDVITQMIDESDSFIDETLRDWERKFGLNDKEEPGDNRSNQSYSGGNYDPGFESKSKDSATDDYTSPYSKQVIEDLQLFSLSPPVKLEEVKKARNREIKKFHPDKFLQQPEKMETAKKIIQIYNTAYERLTKVLG